MEPEANSDPEVFDRLGNNRYIQAGLNHQVTVLEDLDQEYEEDTKPNYLKNVDWSNRYEPRLEELHKELRERRFSQTPIFQLDYPKITFLGTVSGMPMTLRNNSSVLVESAPGRCGQYRNIYSSPPQKKNHLLMKKYLKVSPGDRHCLCTLCGRSHKMCENIRAHKIKAFFHGIKICEKAQVNQQKLSLLKRPLDSYACPDHSK